MNSLIGLGALTSFAAGVAGPLAPGMAFDTSFLEEPVMLLAFVLLGRSLEARARLRASGAHPVCGLVEGASGTVYWLKLCHDDMVHVRTAAR